MARLWFILMSPMRPARFSPRSLAAIRLLLAACSAPARVEVHASLASGVPLTDLAVTALPFDAERVFDSLARLSPTPRPDFSALEARLQAYRRQATPAADPNDASGLNAAWMAVRDSVARMARELSHGDRKSSAYREAYLRFRQLYARYSAKEAEREARARNLHSGDRVIAEEATHASDSLRAWETQAYGAFPAAAEAQVARLGRSVTATETDSVGTVELELANGDWWVTARARDPENPFLEIYWNVPLRVAGGLPFSVPLMPENATTRWRH